jgi:tripartite-type tricarboxylate transporter receptor subunit TctC
MSTPLPRRALQRWVLSSMVAGALPWLPAQAQEFPARGVKIVVAGPPGGGTDYVARLIAEKLAARWKQSVVVENRAGASGIIGTKYVMGMPADGYVVMLGHVATHAIVPALHHPPPYDAVRDFTPISLVATAPDVLVVGAQSPLKSIQDLVNLARERPGAVTYGSPGVGLPQHLTGFMLGKTAGVQMRHVPYKGSTPALADLMGGHIHAMFVTPGAVMSLVREGRVRPLAVTSGRRSKLLPEVPSVSEVGFAALERDGWFGMFGPAGMSQSVLQLLSTEIASVMGQTDVRSKVESQLMDPVVSTHSEFAQFHRQQVAQWTEIVRESGVKAES